MMNRAAPIFLALAVVCLSSFGQVNERICGPLGNGFGPFDYRADRDPYTPGTGNHVHKLGLVEGAHFPNQVELLIKGNRSGDDPGGDIDYTLRAFPNHHRALMSVMRYGEKKRSQKPDTLTYQVECYFERAIRFSKDDPIVFMLYATYLNSRQRPDEAVAQLVRASSLAKKEPFTQYNVGLIYYDMKKYDEALVQAHKATALGFERTQLRELLEKIGHWEDPVAASK